MTARYWFARRYPINDPRNSVAPVCWQGYAVALGFVGGMMLSGVAFLVLATGGRPDLGIVAFCVGAIVSGALFIMVSRRAADMTRTVEDYRAERAS